MQKGAILWKCVNTFVPYCLNPKLCYCTQVEPCMTLILTEIKHHNYVIGGGGDIDLFTTEL